MQSPWGEEEGGAADRRTEGSQMWLERGARVMSDKEGERQVWVKEGLPDILRDWGSGESREEGRRVQIDT